MTDTEQTGTAAGTEARAMQSGHAAHLPGDGAMWVMVLGDLVLLRRLFIIFMVHRAMAPEEFLHSQQHLNLTIGVVNTLVLVSSSWFIARGVNESAIGRPRRRVAVDYLGGTCRLLFIVIKAYEWSAEIAAGHTMPSDQFFMFYYMLTGVHLFHVGLGLLDPRNRRARAA